MHVKLFEKEITLFISIMNYQILYQSLFQRTIPVLRVQGRIDSEIAISIKRQLNSYNKRSIAALALVINSQGGCPYQIEQISNSITSYVKQVQVPLYTFTTDQALQEAYKLLTIGDKIYAQTTSKIGQTSYYQNHFHFQKFLSNYGIEIQKQIDKPNSYKNILSSIDRTTNEQQKLEQLLQKQNAQLNKDISQRLLQIKQNDIQHQIYFGQQAKELGLIDEIGTYEQILLKQFPKAKILPITAQSTLQKYINWLNLFIKITQSRGFLGLMLLLFIKGTIKWTLIVIVWRQARKQKKLEELKKQQEKNDNVLQEQQ